MAVIMSNGGCGIKTEVMARLSGLTEVTHTTFKLGEVTDVHEAQHTPGETVYRVDREIQVGQIIAVRTDEKYSLNTEKEK